MLRVKTVESRFRGFRFYAALGQLLLGQEAVAGNARVTAYPVKVGEINIDLRSRRLADSFFLGSNERGGIGRGPGLLPFFAQIVSGFEKFAKLAVPLVQQGQEAVPVKAQGVIALLLPDFTPALVAAGRVQDILPGRLRRLLPVYSIGQGPPGVCLTHAEAVCEKLSGCLPHGGAPEVSEEMPPLFRLRHDRGLR